MSVEPPIPNAHDAVAVARWFVEHDVDLQYLRTHCPHMKEWVVDDIRMAAQTLRDVRQIRRLYRKWLDISSSPQPWSAARLHRGDPFAESVPQVEAFWWAKTRILGYLVEQMAAGTQDDHASVD
jgi:hypothetical protein